MSSSKVFIAILALSLCGQGFGLAVPTHSLNLVRRTVPPDNISKYTVQWFLDNVIQKPTLNDCVFYTADQSEHAQEFAKARLLSTIWSVWAPIYSIPGVTACDLYNHDIHDTNNALREIMANRATRNTYFTHMSQAYAELCSGEAILMSAEPNNPPTDGIWGQTEFPTIKKTGNPGGQVNKLAVTDPRGRSFRTFWTRPSGGTVTRRHLSDLKELAERARTYTTCLTPQQIQQYFGDINW